MLDLNKKYVTRAKRFVVTLAAAPSPIQNMIVGYITLSSLAVMPLFWSTDGKSPVSPDLDLVEATFDLAVDTRVIVGISADSITYRQYFSHFADGVLHTFVDGGTSWSVPEKRTHGWSYWKLFEEGID
jgi:hypothetical protein